MMHKVLSCFGFVSDFTLDLTQASGITRLKSKSLQSCTDHQLFFSSLVIAPLTGLILLGFFHFSEPNFQFPFLRLNANTHVERRFECFGFVSGNIWPFFIKQIPLILLLINRTPLGGREL